MATVYREKDGVSMKLLTAVGDIDVNCGPI